jgi:protein NrfD
VVAAETRAPYGRHAESRHPERTGTQPTPTYYDRPAVKASHYRWLVVTYFFVGGLAGAAQVLTTLVDMVGRSADRPLARHGRYVALAGALMSPALLIADLHFPSRWYNMLRIFRPTSPMSIGSWTLGVFGAFSGLAALGQVLADLGAVGAGRRLARLSGAPAAAAGAVMACYTGVLLSATSTPLWFAAPRLLPPLFAASATSTATAALSLAAALTGAPEPTRRRLATLGLVAGLAEAGLLAAIEAAWRRRGVAGALGVQPAASFLRLGAWLVGLVVPLALHAGAVAGARPGRPAAGLAALATLVGGFALRAAVVFAGNESARRPRDYFGLASSDGAVR